MARTPTAESLLRDLSTKREVIVTGEGQEGFLIPNYSGLQAVRKTDATISTPSKGVEGSIQYNASSAFSGSSNFLVSGGKFLLLSGSNITLQTSGAQVLISGGSSTLPSIAFYEAPTTGIYIAGTGIGLATAGTSRLTCTTTVNLNANLTMGSSTISTATTGGVTLTATLGSATTPCYTFSSDLNTGMYRSQADQLEFAVGGTRTLMLSGGSTAGIYISGGTFFRTSAAPTIVTAEASGSIFVSGGELWWIGTVSQTRLAAA